MAFHSAWATIIDKKSANYDIIYRLLSQNITEIERINANGQGVLLFGYCCDAVAVTIHYINISKYHCILKWN